MLLRFRTLSIQNIYFAGAGITEWVVYFCKGTADAFVNVRLKASEEAKEIKIDHSLLLRELDQRQKQVLSLFNKSKYITTGEIAELLGVHSRTALNLCKKWVENEFIIQHGTANKFRKYELALKWLRIIL